MSETVIKIENLGKKYKLGSQEPYFSLRDNLSDLFNFKKKSKRKEIWALRGINLELKRGEALGIIGANGAGKSTLLKVLSQITPPTTGRAIIKGRVASLLEVGTGFHPELTGRENIFLNGAILGMAQKEIKKKFDQIVDFAGIAKFLDTPVKRYSSGMYVRLAFAVAAHLDSEILIIDEVLAVGDAAFQKKCLGRMGEIGKEGRTLLLVSHNMHSILSLSTKCLLLSKGKAVKIGDPAKVVRYYQQNLNPTALGQTDLSKVQHYGSGEAKFIKIFMRPKDKNGQKLPFFVTGCDIEAEMIIQARSTIKNTTVALIIYDEEENRLIDVNTLIKGHSLNLTKGQKIVVKFLLKNIRLKPDNYTVGLWLGTLNVGDIDGIKYATSFKMEANHEDILYTSPFPGVYAPEFEYKIDKI